MARTNNLMEEEMVRLAEEMSLIDEFDLQFNPQNLGETKGRLKFYEDIVDEHLGLRDREGELFYPDGRVSDSQLKTLFYPNDEDFGSHASSRKGPTIKPTRISSRGREQKIKDTVGAICRSLKWYQTKILNEIEKSSEVCLICQLQCYGDDRFGYLQDKNLAALLELNDRVSNVLTKADWLAQSEAVLGTENSFSYSPPTSFMEGGHSPFHDRDRESNEHFNAMIHSAVYAIRRGIDSLSIEMSLVLYS